MERSVVAWMENQNNQTMPRPVPMKNLWKIITLKMENHKPTNRNGLLRQQNNVHTYSIYIHICILKRGAAVYLIMPKSITLKELFYLS